MRSHILIKLVTIISLLTVCANADIEFAGGDGSTANPYQIQTSQQFQEFVMSTELEYAHFILISDIDLSEIPAEQHLPIGYEYSYKGYANRLDIAGGKIYWTDEKIMGIGCSNLNGKERQMLVNTTAWPWDIEIDTIGEKIYWTELNQKRIMRANLDGSGIEQVLTLSAVPTNMALDLNHNRIYWSSGNSIYKSTIGGSTTIVRTTSRADVHIDCDPNSGKLYFIDGLDYNTGNLQYYDPVESKIITLFFIGSSSSLFTIDFDKQIVYSIDPAESAIYQIKLDASWLRSTPVSYTSWRDMVLDFSSSVMYICAGDYWHATETWSYSLIDSSCHAILPGYTEGFGGVFDGNGHEIRNFRFISAENKPCGLFSMLNQEAIVRNLTVRDAYIDAPEANCVGVIFGSHNDDERAYIRNCKVTSSYVRGHNNVGGIGGTGSDRVSIEDCYCNAEVQGADCVGGILGFDYSNMYGVIRTIFDGDVNGVNYVGGIAGRGGAASYCRSSGVISGVTNVGGIMGRQDDYYGIWGCCSDANIYGDNTLGGITGVSTDNIYGCYFTGCLIGISDIGGIAALADEYSRIEGCYFAGDIFGIMNVGGITARVFNPGYMPAQVVLSVWDEEYSYISFSQGGTGLSTAEMKSYATFADLWACQTIGWTIDDKRDYPRLQWEKNPGLIISRTVFSGGKGTYAEPYLLSTAQDLLDLSSRTCDQTACFKLTNDIDMGAYAWVKPIFTGFSGVFDGGGHVISNLRLKANGEYYGLFMSSSGVIKNLGLVNVHLDTDMRSYAGALVGNNSGTVAGCFVTGELVNGYYVSGLMVGYNRGKIENCYVQGRLQSQYAGGIAGSGGTDIRNCYAAVDTSACYSAGAIVGSSSTWSLTRCYYDSSLASKGTGNGTPSGVTGLSTAQMEDSAWFIQTGWDFVNETVNGTADMWSAGTRPGYMILWWQRQNPATLPGFSGGDGSEANPFIIASVDDFLQVGRGERIAKLNYVLAKDIDLKGIKFEPIGSRCVPFAGRFDGQGHTLLNADPNCKYSTYAGIFGMVVGGEISNLGCADVNVINSDIPAGGLAGAVYNSVIKKCWLTGTVYGKREGLFIGTGEDSAISMCWTVGTGTYNYYVTTGCGGIAADLERCTVDNCFTDSRFAYYSSGGIAANITGSKVTNCYANGQRITYAFACSSKGTIYQNCIYDVNASRPYYTADYSSTVTGIEGLSTITCRQRATYESRGWDFNSVWTINEGQTYPVLQGMPLPAPRKICMINPVDMWNNPATNVPLVTDVNWFPNGFATKYRVYFGTTNPPPFYREQTDFNFGASLTTNTIYYLRVDCVGPEKVTQGDVAQFTAMPWFGKGTSQEPYLLERADQFAAMKLDTFKDQTFKLAGDLDLAGVNWSALTNFNGTFDGDGHTISNLRISDPCAYYGGMFSGAKSIVNVTFINADINTPKAYYTGVAAATASSLTNCRVINCKASGKDYVGALSGNCGSITDCTVSGCQVSGGDSVGGMAGRCWSNLARCSANATSAGTKRVGGLVGLLYYDSSNKPQVLNCSATGVVTGGDMVGGLIGDVQMIGAYDSYAQCTVNATGANAGGLAGNFAAGQIERCYSACDVAAASCAGGIAGSQGTQAGIWNCYTRSTVQGGSSAGGITGNLNSTVSPAVLNCYSTGKVSGTSDIGGLIGKATTGTVQLSFWDKQTSMLAVSAGGIAKTTAEMKSAACYADWGCNTLWTILEGVDYPTLAWQNLGGTVIGSKWFEKGSGTLSDPYLIETPEQLQHIGGDYCLSKCYYKLANDINMVAYDGQAGRPKYNIIGTAQIPFSGGFDGNSFKISDVYIKNGPVNYVGVFGNMGWPELKNIKLSRITIDSPDSNYVGALAGYSNNVTNCTATDVNITGKDYVGGLTGYCYSMKQCCAKGWITGRNTIGGVAGRVQNISVSYAETTCKGSTYVGGLIGWNSDGGLSDCYTTGSVTATNYGGGVAGYSTVSNKYCYSRCAVNVSGSYKGALIGYGGAYKSFYDKTISVVQGSDGLGLTPVEMANSLIYILNGWDFINERTNGSEDKWRLCNGFPKLQFEYSIADIVCPDGVDFNEISVLATEWLVSGRSDLLSDITPKGRKDAKVDFKDFAVFAQEWMK